MPYITLTYLYNLKIIPVSTSESKNYHIRIILKFHFYHQSNYRQLHIYYNVLG